MAVTVTKYTKIDINCDLGEASEHSQWQYDVSLMDNIDRCNIACGGHAGNAESIAFMLAAAKSQGILAGAHPSYPDKDNFGRVTLAIPHHELCHAVKQQLQCIKDIAKDCDVSLSHVKFHGALYNDMENNELLAQSMCEIVDEVLPSTPILGLAHGKLANVCQQQGISFLHEAFIDRRYTADAKLAPRQQPHSVISDIPSVLAQAQQLLNGLPFKAITGEDIMIHADSLCLHGDHPQSLAIAQQLKQQQIKR